MPRKKGAAVSEPIQVYLTNSDRAMLDQVAEAANLSRAEVLRRGLRSYGASVLATANPVADFLDAMSAEPWPSDMPSDMPSDVAARHDDYLTERPTPRRKSARR